MNKLHVVRIHVMIQMLIVNEVCQIFSVGIGFLRSLCDC